MNDISVYLDRQRGGGGHDLKNAFCTHVLHFEAGAVRFSLSERLMFETPMLGTETTRKALKLVLSIGDTSPPLST